MAEINSSSGNNRKHGAVQRCKKLSTKVDLTPMVDLGFLLITFFVFTTSMSRPNSIHLFLPVGDVPSLDVGKSTALTVIPLDNDKVFYYHGDLQTAMRTGTYGNTSLSVTNGIGDIIRQKQHALNNSLRFTGKDLMLIIKPAATCSYKNIVAILDEVMINDVKHYSMVDVDNADRAVLKTIGN